MEINELKQRGLTLDKLLAFLSVVRAGSVMQAAGGVESRRSLMSRQIGELEGAMGAELFLRKGKSLQITAAGKELALLTATYVNELESMSTRFSGDQGILKIGAGAAVLEAMVYPAIRNLRRDLPDYRFEFMPDSTEGIVRQLHDGGMDLGIVRSNLEDASLIRWPCGTMKFVLVGRRDFDSNLPEWSAMQFLTRVPMALICGDGSLVTTLHEMVNAAGANLVPTCSVDTFGHVKQLLLGGQPGGLLPEILAGDLSRSDFHVIKDVTLDALDRPLDLVVEKRAARVRDRLEGIATTVVRTIKRDD